MATKYWYVTSNGNALWSAATNWYNGPGGTGGTTTVPTAADDVYLTSSSGSGILTISTAATCLSLTCTGFTGTLAGTSTLAIVNGLTLSSGMTLTFSGTTTFTGVALLYSSTKTITFNIIVNVTTNSFTFMDDTTFVSTTTFTLTSGTLYFSPSTINLGLFVSGGAVARYISGSGTMNITGVGTVWNVSGTLFGIDLGLSPIIYITDQSSSAKTITNSATTAPSGTPPSGNPTWNFQPQLAIIGSGTGAYTLNGNFYGIYFNNTGIANVSFGASNIYYELNFGTSYVNWNNGATTITINQDNVNITLSPNMTITTSAPLTISNPSAGSYVYLTSNGKYLTATITISGAGGLFAADNFYSTGAVTVTLGTFNGNYDAYVGTISSSNANVRTISFTNLYFLGTGTLLTTTNVTNLLFGVDKIYVTNSTATAKTLSLNTIVYPATAVYLGGSGSGSITLAASTSGIFDIYVTNTGGAAISFSTATVKSINFSPGTNAIWSNVAAQTLTIQGNLSIASSAGTPTLTPALVFNGGGFGGGSISLGGKSLVTGAVTINDTAFGSGSGTFNFTDAFSTNATSFVVTSANYVQFDSSFSSSVASTLTLTFATQVTFNGPVTGLSTVSVLNAILSINSTFVTTGTITVNNSNGIVYVGNNVGNSGSLNTPALTITNGNLILYNNITISGTLTLTTGYIQVIGKPTITVGIFSSSGSGARTIDLGYSNWILTGTGTVWNLTTITNLSYLGSPIVTITDSSSTTNVFAGGGNTYNTLQIARGGATGSTQITGNNTFVNFIDLGTATHSLLFTAASTQTIGNFVVNGNPAGQISLNSTTTATFTLTKSPAGLVNCDYLNIQHCVASPSTGTWYAGTNSVNNQAVVTAGSGWIFTNIPPRKLGAGGVG